MPVEEWPVAPLRFGISQFLQHAQRARAADLTKGGDLDHRCDAGLLACLPPIDSIRFLVEYHACASSPLIWAGWLILEGGAAVADAFFAVVERVARAGALRAASSFLYVLIRFISGATMRRASRRTIRVTACLSLVYIILPSIAGIVGSGFPSVRWVVIGVRRAMNEAAPGYCTSSRIQTKPSAMPITSRKSRREQIWCRLRTSPS